MSDDGGRLIGGRYRLTERIGSGGMGTVWRAVDERVERDVAVKEPRLPGDPRDSAHRRAYHRLQREARAAARVDHPGAVAIHDVVVEDGLPWIVMELIRGESLHERLRRGALSPAESARIGLAVVGALGAAHAKGIVHRDVKPANVLLGQHDRVVLTDFGIAHIQGEESLTLSGEFVGSLEFIAPERMSGRNTGPAGDLWSLGVCLYAAVEGWSPFRRTTLESTLAAILSTEPPEPEQAGPLGPLIVRLLAKDPALRPDADEVAAALEAVAEGWPLPRGESAPAQNAADLREYADDTGTVRLSRPSPARAAAPDPAPNPAQDPAPAHSTPTSTGPVEPGPPDAAAGDGADAATGGGAGAGSDPDADADGRAESDADADAGTEADAGSEADAGTEAGSDFEAGAGSGGRPADRDLPARRRRPAVPARVRLAGGVLAVALVVAGGAWSATTLTGDEDEAVADTGPSAPVTATANAPSDAAGWVPHAENGLRAVLSLPLRYVRRNGQDDPGGDPRTAVYDGGAVQVRLTQWDEAPRPPMEQARESGAAWAGYGRSRTQYTRTSFDGQEAVLADTTYENRGEVTRVMELMILTGDGRMYELRVDMPKGERQEKTGTAVFKGARDRLRIGT
ncbi:serine/threonine-protein kinase [Streptomyces fructofermentans]|uniref:serine/threonine-protein kinase n=1 Tax=Streptomyces fructofermentans TaxID=152141 RepID=UPI00378F4B2A